MTEVGDSSVERLQEVLGGQSSGAILLAEFLGAVLDTAQFIILVLDRRGTVLYFNPYFETLSGYSLTDMKGRGWFDTCIPSQDIARLRELFDLAMSGQARRGEVNSVRMKDGSLRAIEWCDKPLATGDGKEMILLSIGRDVTPRRGAIQEMKALNEELERRVRERTAVLENETQFLTGSSDASSMCLAYLDRDMNFLRVNKSYAAADEKEPDFFVGKNHFELFPHDENEQIFYRVRDTGTPYSVLAKPFEYASVPERGVTHWDWTLSPVLDAQGDTIGLVLALRDVSERMEALEVAQNSERRLAGELAEKEVLLQELHHRVKNNLQMVSSLLYLQAAQTEDKKTATLLDESRTRVRAMALVHETIYGSGDFALVDIESYLDSLVSALDASFANNDTQVEFAIDVSTGPLSLQAAVPCGLIACELITNAVKHAFVSRQRGMVRLRLEESTDEILCLEVRDDGVGISTEAAHGTGPFGIKLVKALANQLGGTLEISSDGGSCFRVLFPRARNSDTQAN